MILTHLRSSALGSWGLCPWQWALRYAIGLPDKSGHKALLGNVCHKALELLARQRLAEQRDSPLFSDPDSAQVFETDREEFTAEKALDFAWERVTGSEDGKLHSWTRADRRNSAKWVNVALTHAGGIFDPRNREIIDAERFFDIEVPEPWAEYNFKLPDGTRLRGRLRLHGTVDLVTRQAPGVVEVTDYKTGRIWDWGKNREKTYDSLHGDQQLLLYYYAMRQLFPEDQVIMTIFYLQFARPFSLCFGDGDLRRAGEMIRLSYETIRDTEVPGRIAPDRRCNFCHYAKTPGLEDPSENTCDFYHRKTVQLGMDRVLAEYGDPKALGSYQGGGRGYGNRTE